jgi:hypothetical protein
MAWWSARGGGTTLWFAIIASARSKLTWNGLEPNDRSTCQPLQHPPWFGLARYTLGISRAATIQFLMGYT